MVQPVLSSIPPKRRAPKKKLLSRLGLFSFALLVTFSQQASGNETTSLFDGETLNGWHSPKKDLWRIEDGAITVGSHSKKFPRNEWIGTEKSYANFDLTLKIKCSGDLATGQVNSGIQIRSAWLPNKTVAGYPVSYTHLTLPTILLV